MKIDGKKDGDQMQITKKRLKQIILEEKQKLDESQVSPLKKIKQQISNLDADSLDVLKSHIMQIQESKRGNR